MSQAHRTIPTVRIMNILYHPEVSHHLLITISSSPSIYPLQKSHDPISVNIALGTSWNFIQMEFHGMYSFVCLHPLARLFWDFHTVLCTNRPSPLILSSIQMSDSTQECVSSFTWRGTPDTAIFDHKQSAENTHMSLCKNICFLIPLGSRLAGS